MEAKAAVLPQTRQTKKKNARDAERMFVLLSPDGVCYRDERKERLIFDQLGQSKGAVAKTVVSARDGLLLQSESLKRRETGNVNFVLHPFRACASTATKRLAEDVAVEDIHVV